VFKLEPNPTFRCKIHIPVPGTAKGVPIEFEFRHKAKTTLQAYIEEAKTGEEVALLEEVIVGWSGVDAEYSRDSLALLLNNFPAAGAAILAGYVRELADARLGN